MSRLDRLVNQIIAGSRNCWYYNLMVGRADVSGGYFFTRKNARKVLKNHLRSLFNDDETTIEYLTMKLKNTVGD